MLFLHRKGIVIRAQHFTKKGIKMSFSGTERSFGHYFSPFVHFSSYFFGIFHKKI